MSEPDQHPQCADETIDEDFMALEKLFFPNAWVFRRPCG